MPATAPPAAPRARNVAPAPDPGRHSARIARVTLRTLGECRIVVEHAAGTTTLTPASDRLFTLLLLLAAEPGRSVPRARAAAWLWPDLPEAAARHALRQLVYRLRQLGATIEGDTAHLALATDDDGPSHDAPPHDEPPHDAPPRAGRCLPGWDPPGAALRAWVDRYRATVEAATRASLARALADALAANRDGTALAAALLELDPRHPLARATLPRTAVVREPPPAADALPCIGRDDLLHALHTHAAAARDGYGCAVVLAAPTGSGVTRVITELTRSARALGFTVVTAPDTALTPASVAHALATAVRTLLDRPGALGCSPDALRVAQRFVATPLLPTGDTTVRRLGTAIAELARAVGSESPLLLAVDARCATPPERALAATIARALDAAAVLAIFTAIPATPCTFGALGTVTRVLPVPPLADPDAATLANAAARARGATIQPDDLAWCVTMARGRPGDVIALAHACTTRPGTRTLPSALAARLRDHIAALPPRTRHVAALCTLLGDTDVADRAARALGRRRSAVDAALFELRRANLPGDPLADDPRPTHRDAIRLVGTTALATLDAGEREVLIARAAERRSTTRSTEARRTAVTELTPPAPLLPRPSTARPTDSSRRGSPTPPRSPSHHPP